MGNKAGPEIVCYVPVESAKGKTASLCLSVTTPRVVFGQWTRSEGHWLGPVSKPRSPYQQRLSTDTLFDVTETLPVTGHWRSGGGLWGPTLGGGGVVDVYSA